MDVMTSKILFFVQTIICALIGSLIPGFILDRFEGVRTPNGAANANVFVSIYAAVTIISGGIALCLQDKSNNVVWVYMFLFVAQFGLNSMIGPAFLSSISYV